ncbi:MAG: HNH endonuclease [Alphaproteobacteria bacterium]|nr:MAG: HNH endonuclease [Alphaproteobacteria bacterium]
MLRRPGNPEQLEGEELQRWYKRTSTEIDAERTAAKNLRHRAFFGRTSGDAESGLRAEPIRVNETSGEDDTLWIATGLGGYRRIRPRSYDRAQMPSDEVVRPPHLPSHAAAPEAGKFQEVGNPENPRLRREWEIANRKPWPRTTEGRQYDVAHIRAIADGGTNTLDNIRPMDPVEHAASHKDDSSRWGKRSSIARAFGGSVEPPAHAPRPRRGPVVRGLGFLGLLPNITGILSGRIRTDTPVHLWNDLLGYSSEDDVPKKDLII